MTEPKAPMEEAVKEAVEVLTALRSATAFDPEDTLLSALSRGDGPPEGWVLVPKIPTTEQRRKNAARVAIMLRAVTGKDFAGWDFADDLYDQFVRGAPKPITPNTLRDNGLSVETSPELITCPGVGWRPMTTVRDARDGRHVLLKPVKTRAAALIVDGGVIGHWVSDEREWFVAINAKDLQRARGWGLIDDDFEGWKPLPDKPLCAMIAASPPVPEGGE